MDATEAAANTFRQGGITPVFNEISVLLALSPARPAADKRFEDLAGPKDRVLMRNVIDETGIVQPTVFIRSNTFAEPHTGLSTQVLALAVCSAVGTSQLLGGELSVHVKNAAAVPGLAPPDLPPGALSTLEMPLVGGRAVTPQQPSIGKIQALSQRREFPARVTIPVYYTYILGIRDGKLANYSDTVSIEGREPHFMEAVVASVPPDPETVLRGREWDLVTDAGGFLKLWTRVEYFRFLGLGDWSHKQRVTYKGGAGQTARTGRKSGAKKKSK